MAEKTILTKTDVLTAALCIVILCFCLGAVGSRGAQQQHAILCTANLHQLDSATDQYKSDNSGYYPFALAYKAQTLQYSDYLSEVSWWHFLKPYLKDVRSIKCPRNPGWPSGYSFNVEFGYVQPDPANPPPVLTSPMYVPIKDSAVQNPSTKIHITSSTLTYFNCTIGYGYSSNVSQLYALRIYPASKGNATAPGNDYYMKVNYGYKEAGIHRGGVNNLFADGHVQWKSIHDLTGPVQWFPVESRVGNPWSLRPPPDPYTGP
jgi:prepilin-type processing-associated H-X9-DG protein